MKNKKEKLEISLATAICIIIIVILMIVCVISYYSGYVKGKQTKTHMEEKTKEVEEKIDILIKQNEEKNEINHNNENILIEENN